VALSTQRTFTDHREVVAVASEMKQVAKRSPGSVVAVDRRREREPGRGPAARGQGWEAPANAPVLGGHRIATPAGARSGPEHSEARSRRVGLEEITPARRGGAEPAPRRAGAHSATEDGETTWASDPGRRSATPVWEA
jgi:hypothetical protein